MNNSIILQVFLPSLAFKFQLCPSNLISKVPTKNKKNKYREYITKSKKKKLDKNNVWQNNSSLTCIEILYQTCTPRSSDKTQQQKTNTGPYLPTTNFCNIPCVKQGLSGL